MPGAMRWFIPLILFIAICLGVYFYYIAPAHTQISAESVTIIKRRLIEKPSATGNFSSEVKVLQKDLDQAESLIESPFLDEMTSDLNQF